MPPRSPALVGDRAVISGVRAAPPTRPAEDGVEFAAQPPERSPITTLATVLVPTHNHGSLLSISVGSALQQTVKDIEVFIVGDGATPSTREAAMSLRDSDERIHFFDNPKGPRHGELHRHEALRQASGDIVCYLSDDDLWLPDHVANALAMLSGADFAHSLPTQLRIDGSLGVWAVDLALEYYRAMLLGGENAIPLTSAAHTLSLYRRLRHGWRTTPEGTPTDLYMWQQILETDNVVAVSGTAPTALSFPASARRLMTEEDRLAELRNWARRLPDPQWSSQLHRDVLDLVVRHRAALLAARQVATDDFGAALAEATDRELRASQQVAELTQRNASLADAHDDDQRRIDSMRSDHQQVVDQLGETAEQLDAAYGSATWRLRNALLSVPGLKSVYGWLSRALSPP